MHIHTYMYICFPYLYFCVKTNIKLSLMRKTENKCGYQAFPYLSLFEMNAGFYRRQKSQENTNFDFTFSIKLQVVGWLLV